MLLAWVVFSFNLHSPDTIYRREHPIIGFLALERLPWPPDWYGGVAPSGGLRPEFHAVFGSFDVTDSDCIITLSGIHNQGNGSAPAPPRLGILILRSFSPLP